MGRPPIRRARIRGRIGDFSTAHGEALEVVQTYTARVGANPLARDYLPRLQALATSSSPAVDGIAGFPAAWQAARTDPVFREVQDDVMQTRYVDPALARANDLGITTRSASSGCSTP